jgi:hypothetical protein
MATYTPGDNEDHVIKTTSYDQNLDLTVFIEKFTSLKSQLQALPKAKTVPDQETLDHWMGTVYIEGQDQKVHLDGEVVELHNEATAIKNTGLLPAKYNDEYQQLEDYVNSL